MITLVVYDSTYGNTEDIAKSVGNAIAGEIRIVRASEADPAYVNTVDLLVVGSPTYGGRATQPIQDFLAKIPDRSVKGKKVAAFDTRYAGKFVKVFGFASEKIAEVLKAKGGNLASIPEGFIVKGKKGPLKEGELERAASWAVGIAK